jgi:hypothetical protein
MVERGERLSLPFEPGMPIRIISQQIGQDLEGDVAIELRVARAVDLAHAARADEREHFVRAEVRPGR